LSTLFRPLPKRVERVPLNVRYVLEKDAVQLRFSARCALGIPEQTLLLTLLELAREQFTKAPDESLVDNGSQEPISQLLWNSLHRQQPAEGQTVRIDTTWHSLNSRVGAGQGGKSNLLRREQLQRLCEVVVWEERIGPSGSLVATRQSFLVSWVLGDSQHIHLVLNQRLADALLGGRYAQVSLHERFQLHTDLARALHAYFCVTLQSGIPRQFHYSTLQERFFPASEGMPQSTLRGQRKAVKDALMLLKELKGWDVQVVRSVYGLEMAQVLKRSPPKKAKSGKHLPNSDQVTVVALEVGIPINDSTLSECSPLDVSSAFGRKVVAAGGV